MSSRTASTVAVGLRICKRSDCVNIVSAKKTEESITEPLRWWIFTPSIKVPHLTGSNEATSASSTWLRILTEETFTTQWNYSTVWGFLFSRYFAALFGSNITASPDCIINTLCHTVVCSPVFYLCSSYDGVIPRIQAHTLRAAQHVSAKI